MNINKVAEYITNIEEEIGIYKMVNENVASRNEAYVPMIVFYSSPTEKSYVVAPHHDNTFNNKMLAIAETLHLYSSSLAHAAIISMLNQVVINDNTYQSLDIYALSLNNAYLIQLPFEINGTEVKWLEEHQECTSIDELDVDSTGKDVLSMFYHYIHIDSTIFTPEDVLSYLSFKKAEINTFSTKVQYLNFVEN